MNYNLTHPLPYKDIVYNSTSTKDNTKTNDNGCHYSWSLIEMEKCKQNYTWKIRN